jgi:hypothetical protein
MTAHCLKLTAHRKKMTTQFLSMTSQFVPMRHSYQKQADPLVPVKPDFANENFSHNALICQTYPASLPLLLIASRNISGLHKKTCAGATNAKRVQSARTLFFFTRYVGKMR